MDEIRFKGQLVGASTFAGLNLRIIPTGDAPQIPISRKEVEIIIREPVQRDIPEGETEGTRDVS